MRAPSTFANASRKSTWNLTLQLGWIFYLIKANYNSACALSQEANCVIRTKRNRTNEYFK